MESQASLPPLISAQSENPSSHYIKSSLKNQREQGRALEYKVSRREAGLEVEK